MPPCPVDSPNPWLHELSTTTVPTHALVLVRSTPQPCAISRTLQVRRRIPVTPKMPPVEQREIEEGGGFEVHEGVKGVNTKYSIIIRR